MQTRTENNPGELTEQLFRLVGEGKYEEATKIIDKENIDVRNLTGCSKNTLLHVVVESPGVNDFIAYLIQTKQMDVNCTNHFGATPLFIAVSNRRLKVVNTLLAHDANVNLATTYGRTPLHSASQFSSLDVINALLVHGTNVNQADRDGATPLWAAASLGRSEIVEILLAHGADLNQANNHGMTPLWFATCFGHFEFVKTLLVHGANVNQADRDDATPLWAAAQQYHNHTHPEYVRVLLDAGADPSRLAGLHTVGLGFFAGEAIQAGVPNPEPEQPHPAQG